MNKDYSGINEEGEVQRVVYKHIIAIAPFIFVVSILTILNLVGVYYVARYQPSLGGVLPAVSAGLISIVLFLLIALFAAAIIWIWRSNKVVITDECIIDIDQVGLFKKTVSTLNFSNVQDISTQISGPMQTLLKYGTIIVQTAGERENFHFDYIPNPDEVRDYILKLHHAYLEKHPQSSSI